jgi:hypothetical protein
MTNIQQNQAVSQTKSILDVLESHIFMYSKNVFKEPRFIQQFWLLILIALIGIGYCQYFSFSSEIRFIQNKFVTPGDWQYEEAFMLTLAFELIKSFFILKGIVGFFTIRRFFFVYLVIAISFSAGSWYMSLQGTPHLAKEAVGEAPKNDTLSPLVSIYEPQLTDIKSRIQYQDSIRSANKNWQGAANAGLWGPHSRWFKADTTIKGLLAAKLAVEQQYNHAIQNAQSNYNKSVVKYEADLASKHQGLRHKVAFTETTLHICYLFIYWFLWKHKQKREQELNQHQKKQQTEQRDKEDRTVRLLPEQTQLFAPVTTEPKKKYNIKYGEHLKNEVWSLVNYTAYSRQEIMELAKCKKNTLTEILQDLCLEEIKENNITNPFEIADLVKKYRLSGISKRHKEYVSSIVKIPSTEPQKNSTEHN